MWVGPAPELPVLVFVAVGVFVAVAVGVDWAVDEDVVAVAVGARAVAVLEAPPVALSVWPAVAPGAGG